MTEPCKNCGHVEPEVVEGVLVREDCNSFYVWFFAMEDGEWEVTDKWYVTDFKEDYGWLPEPGTWHVVEIEL